MVARSASRLCRTVSTKRLPLMQSVLDSAGPYAEHIAGLFWIFVVVAVVVYLVVMVFLVHALRRRRMEGQAPGEPRVALRFVAAGVGLTAVVLVALTVSDFFAGRALARTPPDAMRVRITAHQWWWEIEYLDAVPGQRLRTANELHIPVGKPVALELSSDDVIHSFWVPSLNGKKDLIPWYTTSLSLQASRAGTYQGECAEFCGFQHAHMSIAVHAHDPAQFDAWRVAQSRAAPPPADAQAVRGRDIFLNSTCAQCHAITGTDAAARFGPDLTHVASRSTLAAGTLPNDARSMAAWIRNPATFKPGTRMPPAQLADEELDALVTYLGTLR
jgi:cytochrome c oxidase subunit II